MAISLGQILGPISQVFFQCRFCSETEIGDFRIFSIAGFLARWQTIWQSIADFLLR